MSNVSQLVKVKRLVVDWLLVLSCGYLGLSFLGPLGFLRGPLWFPYDVLIAVSIAVAAWWLGDFRHRWWPIAAVRDRHHELRLERKDSKRPWWAK
jgi:hypothetical protein